MKLVTSFQEYKDLIKEKRSNYVNNNGFFPKEIKAYIEKDGLYVTEFPGAMILLCDERQYYQMVVYVSTEGYQISTEEIKQWKEVIGKDVICNVVELVSEDQQRGLIKGLLEEFGFWCELTNREYEMTDVEESRGALPTEGFVLGKATMEQLPEIQKLWESNLPKYVIEEKPQEEWAKIVDSGNLLVVMSKDQEICGASYFDVILGKSVEHHVVVDGTWRGKGLGFLLMEGWRKEAVAKGAKGCYCWIEDQNESSLKMHHRFGMNWTKRVSQQFLLR